MSAATAVPKGTRAQGRTSLLGVVATGTRQDLEPYISLALGLRSFGGFSVRFVTHQAHSAHVASFGLPFAPLKGDPQSTMLSTAFRDAVLSSAPALKAGALLMAEDRKTREMNFPLLHTALRDVDAVLCGISLLTECQAVCQKYGLPLLLCPLLPFSPSGELPLATVLPNPSPYAFLNRLSFDLSGALLWAAYGGSFNRFRATLGVGPQAGFLLEGVPQVAAFSSWVVPRPSDWGVQVHCTSFWRLPEHAAAPPSPAAAPLLHGLTSSPAVEAALRPICIGFGEVPAPDPVAFLRAAAALGHATGLEVIVLAGETDYSAVAGSPRIADLAGLFFEALPAAAAAVGAGGRAAVSAVDDAPLPTKPPGTIRVLVVTGALPLAWLLRRCSLAVHTGAYGPTAAAMEAGVPSVCFPALGEQHFWSARAAALGVSPLVSFPLKSFPEKVVECASVARQAAFLARAAKLAEAVRAQGDGVAAAVSVVRDILARPQHRPCGVTCSWAADDSSPTCNRCSGPFTLTNRRSHCRSCGDLLCRKCLTQRCHLPGWPEDAPQLTCERCLDARRAYFAAHVGQPALPPVPAASSGGGGYGDDGGGVTEVAVLPAAGLRAGGGGAAGLAAAQSPAHGVAGVASRAAAAVASKLMSPSSSSASSSGVGGAGAMASAGGMLRSPDGAFSPLPL